MDDRDDKSDLKLKTSSGPTMGRNDYREEVERYWAGGGVDHAVLGLLEETDEYEAGRCVSEAGDVLYYSVALEAQCGEDGWNGNQEIRKTTRPAAQEIRRAWLRHQYHDEISRTPWLRTMAAKCTEIRQILHYRHGYPLNRLRAENIRKLRERHGESVKGETDE